MSLSGFLLQRIAEDEAAERARLAVACGLIDKPTPAQDLRMRQTFAGAAIGIRAELRRAQIAIWQSVAPVLGVRMIKAMALPYAGHPDYREEWRP